MLLKPQILGKSKEDMTSLEAMVLGWTHQGCWFGKTPGNFFFCQNSHPIPEV